MRDLEGTLNQNLDEYKDLSIELYYSDEVGKDLRQLLNKGLGENYIQKYTNERYSNSVPIMRIETSDEISLLIGDEISLTEINQVLSSS